MRKGVIRSRKAKDKQHNGQKEKGQEDSQGSTKQYPEKKRLCNTKPTKNRVNPIAPKNEQLLFTRATRCETWW